MHRNFFYYVAIFFVVIFISIVFLWLGRFSNTNFTLDKIKAKAKTISSSVDKNINTIIIKSNIYNEKGELIIAREMLVRRPDKLRINVEDFQKNENYIFIANKDKYWFNKPFLPFEVFISQLIPILAGGSSSANILEEESGIQKVENRQYFAVSFLFTNLKIKGYLEPRSFTWPKIEVFTFHQGNWEKMMEMYSQKIEDIKGIKISRHFLYYLYFPEGKQVRQEGRTYSVKMNIDIDDSIFEIPQEN